MTITTQSIIDSLSERVSSTALTPDQITSLLSELLDQIIKAWSDTSSMAATFTGAYAGHSLTVSIQNVTTGSAAYTAWADKLTILEHFNGRTFNSVPPGTAVI